MNRARRSAASAGTRPRRLIAVEHRTDRAAVQVEQTPGAIAVHCPSCNAPLPPPGESKLIECSYCKRVSRIADRTWFQLSGKDSVSESMWLLFHGVSSEHHAIEGAARKHAEKAEAQAEQQRILAEREAHKRAAREERDHEEQARRDAQAAESKTEKELLEQKKERADSMGTFFAIGAFGLVGAVAILVKVMSSLDPPAANRSGAYPREAGAAQAQASPIPPAAVSVRSCACASRVGADKDAFLLSAPAVNHSQWSFDWVHNAGFIETESTINLGGGPGVNVLPPKSTTSELRMGIACEGSVVALVSGNRATAWAANGNGALWSTTLPGAYTPKIVDTSQSASSGGSAAVDTACGASIPVEGGLISLTLGGGKRVRLSLEDGRVK